MKRWLVVCGLLTLVAGVADAGNRHIQTFRLFAGNVDSTVQISPWIPIRGAQRVILRTWSAKAAFHASTDADSAFSDTITVFSVGFTDSISNTNPIIAGDSVVVTSTVLTNADTTSKMVAVSHPPIQELLRGPSNGSGILTFVYPTIPGSTTTDAAGVFGTQYMRVYITPLRRFTVTGSQSTEGKRVNGLKGLRMYAYVVYDNR